MAKSEDNVIEIDIYKLAGTFWRSRRVMLLTSTGLLWLDGWGHFSGEGMTDADECNR